MYFLENDKVRFSVDDAGKLIELSNKETSTDYAGGGSLWRLIYQDGISLEEELDDEGIVPDIQQNGNEIRLIYQEVENEKLAFSLNILISLTDNELRFDIELENKDESRIIRECHCPIIRSCNIEDDHELFFTAFGGQRFENVEKEIDKHHTLYMAQDNKEIQMSTLYPAIAAMNYFMIASEREGLYFGSHDLSFQVTNHYLCKSKGGINAAIIKYPFLAPGEKAVINSNILSPYSGSWHVAAKKYRAWADSWFIPFEIPDSIKKMTSWQRIIMRHQYGKTFFKYDQLDQILHDGMEAGIKTLFMFGWHNKGHDSGYPDYSCDETQGGFDGLKRNIQKFQDNGGEVILYFNGRLIDVASNFYKEKGKNICIKHPDGSEHNEFYKFGGDGTALSHFGNKCFVTACPSSLEWLDILKGFIDTAVELGCDGVFFDQLGTLPAMCFDPNHGHKVPFVNAMAVNAENLRKLRAYTKSKNPEMSLGTEIITDVTARYVDFVHTLRQGTNVINDWQNGEKPKSDMFLELFYYTFPEVILSDREIRDDTDIERRVNFALMKGLRSDVEIYRCRATISKTPHYQAYLAKANVLREKYQDIIMNGKYCDTDHFEHDNPEFFATSFTAGNKLAVMVSQSHLQNAKIIIKTPGYKYVEHDGLNDFTLEPLGKEIRLSVNKHGLALIIFKRGE